jgi:thioredoxin-related protein
MKRLKLSVLFLFTALAVSAQTGVKFEHGSWSEILQKAKNENKMIFVDCYTSWCGPCKKLSKEIFPQEAVGVYFNENFVSIKVDMEKGEGIELKDIFSVKAFPTMLFISKEGKEQHRIVGFRTADKLIAEAKKANENKGFGSYTQRYENGERSPEFLMDYLSVLTSIYKKKEASDVASDFLSKVPEVDLIKDENWQIISKYISDPFSREIKYVQENRVKFSKVHKQMVVERKLKSVYSFAIKGFVNPKNEQCSFDEEGYKKYLQMMEDMNVDKRGDIKEEAELHFAQVLGKWSDYTFIVDTKIQEMKTIGKINCTLIWNYAMRLEQKCDDRNARDHAVKWMEIVIEELTSEKAHASFIRALEVLKKDRVQK